jgi:hypothetical protein
MEDGSQSTGFYNMQQLAAVTFTGSHQMEGVKEMQAPSSMKTT